ncbi:hypothetical protein LOTGIDRAFT_123781 [Lottia gigantea]|uniref:KIF-binding protein n=1 Tax=Lottia gigantea TaxID=225164 RepID=V4BMJ1_LOTGI|nr:hypothetical protein LOTGIDRAFT_123781 [Lottia gigantea]ESO90154.1 hypothetical protein LOTGIDRAFT_123781 [Lottia gigantea]
MVELELYLREDGYKILSKAKILNDEDSKNDPDDDPYKSKYAARELYQIVKNKVENLRINDCEDELAVKIRKLSTAISLKLAINYEETEELSTSEELLNKCLEDVEKYKMQHDCVNLYQAVLNQLAILWSHRRSSEKALKYLELAETIFKTFKQEEGDSPMMCSEWLETIEYDEEKLLRERAANFENTYTLTLYYCAQVFTQLDEKSKAARYCHVTLQRQLNSMKYDPIDWALNAATLSQYYITENIVLARHCLAAASYVFSEAHNDSDIGNDKDLYDQRKADITRCWIKYGLQILDASKDYLTEELADLDVCSEAPESKIFSRAKEEDDSNDPNSSDDYDIQNISQKHLRFDLELTVHEEKITDKPVLVFDDARKVFLQIQEWIQSAKEYYTMNGHCSDYIQLVQDHSSAFKHLAFFELDMDRQCKMHKKRIDMLLEIANVINPQHYLLAKRQLIFEVAETYSSMADLKLAKLESEPRSRTPHAVNKINQLATHGIEQFQAYLDSLKDPKTGFPSKLSENDVRPALVAKFCMGRLYSKLIFPGVEEKLSNFLKSLEHYKFVVDYCKQHPEDQDKVTHEYDICVEMVELLPLKMERIRQLNS